jgi:hypothetical protein
MDSSGLFFHVRSSCSIHPNLEPLVIEENIMIGIDGDQIGPLARLYGKGGDEGLINMIHEWARSVQKNPQEQPSWSIGEEAAMVAMRDAAQSTSLSPLVHVVSIFNQIARPLADYGFERFPGACEFYDASSRVIPGTCSGYRGSLPTAEQRTSFSSRIIQILGP